jgi:hypothetical protein
MEFIPIRQSFGKVGRPRMGFASAASKEGQSPFQMLVALQIDNQYGLKFYLTY